MRVALDTVKSEAGYNDFSSFVLVWSAKPSDAMLLESQIKNIPNLCRDSRIVPFVTGFPSNSTYLMEQ